MRKNTDRYGHWLYLEQHEAIMAYQEQAYPPVTGSAEMTITTYLADDQKPDTTPDPMILGRVAPYARDCLYPDGSLLRRHAWDPYPGLALHLHTELRLSATRVDAPRYRRLLRNISGNSSTFAYHLVLGLIHGVEVLVAPGKVSDTPSFFGPPASAANHVRR